MGFWTFGSTYSDTTALAITRYVAERGALPPTSRQIAKDIRMSPSSLTSAFESRSEMIRRSAASWAAHHSERQRDKVAQQGWAGFVPSDPEEILEARAWLCWRAMSIGDPEMSEAVADAGRAQRRRLSGELRADGVSYEADDLLVRTTSSLLDGLIDAIAAPTDALDPHHAAVVWGDHRSWLIDRRATA